MARTKDSVSAAPPPPPKQAKKASPAFVKYYLLAYNVLSAVGWSTILLLTLVHIFNLDGRSSHVPSATSPTASSTLSRFFSSVPFLKSTPKLAPITFESKLPGFLQPIYRRSLTTFGRVGPTTAIVQSFAVLEVAHVLLGWVRSPLQTTVMQVSSRLFLIWGITEQFVEVRSNPFYTSMILAWSATEVIRYSFYASNLLGYEPPLLLYLRYTTFYVLYPLGASSEAFLIYSTLPASSPIPGPLFKALIQGVWRIPDYIRGILFLIWWPGLYVMYTYMIAQRRKVFGGVRNKGAKAN